MTLVLGGNDMESILIYIRQMILGNSEETHFDPDLIMHINSTFSTLHQMGVGPEETFSILGDKEVWSDFTGETNDYNEVKTYMYLKVKLVFDPPSSANVLAAMERQKDELEWRLNVTASNNAMEEGSDEE